MFRFTPARLLFLVAALGVCGAGLLTQLNARATLYRTPFAEPLPWGPAGEPLTERVVLCVVDGLRVDASRAMASLNTLREQGADWTLSVAPPTASIPLSHVIATGAPQLTIGMLNNTGAAAVGPGFYRTFGSIYTAAHQAGLRTGNVVTWRSPYALEQFLDAPNSLPSAPGYADDDVLLPRLLEVLAQPDAPNLIWVHFDIVDRAGHVAGGASPEYLEMARRTGERIGEIARALDFTRETLVVTADHGHLDRGGHMGGEPVVATVPCVLAGAGIRPGTAGQAEQGDLASTVAWLLGTPIPTHNEGWPLYDALDCAPEVRARRGRDTVAQRLQAYRFRLDRLGLADPQLDAPMPRGLRTDLVDAALGAQQWKLAWSEAANLASALRFRWHEHLALAAQRFLRPRLYAATGLGLGAMVLSGLLRRRAARAGAPPAKNPPVWLIAGIAVGVLVPVGLFLAGGNGYSLSGPGRRGLAPFALPRFGEGALGLIAAYLTARWLARRQTAAAPKFGSVVASVAGGLAAVATAGAAVFLVGFGLDPHPWDQRDPAVAVLLVGLLQFMGVAASALLCSLVVAVRAGRRASAAPGPSG